jgi:glycosyltransferase involved in cell wall biosynthesis
MRAFLHHHSYAYLDTRSYLTWLLVAVAGGSGVHIVLSSGMAGRLREAYRVNEVVPISNAIFDSGKAAAETRAREQLSTVLFIGNISLEKGVFEYLDLLEKCSTAGMEITGKLAGPFQDHETERKVRQRLAGLPSVEYVGPKYGREKEALYALVDVLVFPSRYANEAEPVTIHEALARGVPVIAYGRGAIPEIVGLDVGLVIDPSECFVPPALAQLDAWLSCSSSFEAASRAAARRSAEVVKEGEQRWKQLLTKLVRGEIGGRPQPPPGARL